MYVRVKSRVASRVSSVGVVLGTTTPIYLDRMNFSLREGKREIVSKATFLSFSTRIESLKKVQNQLVVTADSE